jgi:hypothetical protein
LLFVWSVFSIPENYAQVNDCSARANMLHNPLYQDIAASRGCGLIDPHSLLVDDLLRLLITQGVLADPHIRHRLIHVDPARADYVISFNRLNPSLTSSTFAITIHQHSHDHRTDHAKESGPGLCLHRCARLQPDPAAAAAPTVVGLLLDANVATQLVGAPIIGRLSERYGLAFTVFQTVLSLFAQKRLALDARATSCVFTYVGLRIAAIQGDGIGLLKNSID